MNRDDRALPRSVVALLPAVLFFLLSLTPAAIRAAEPGSGDDAVEQMMAGLSDEQVRQLLIEELKKEGRTDAADPPQMKGPAFFLSRLLSLLSSGYDDNRSEVKALFASFPTLGPDLHRVFVKL